MAIINIFSKRQRLQRGEVPDVYTYTVLPQPLRAQIVHIWMDTIGRSDESSPSPRKAYQAIVDALRREYGVFRLPGDKGHGQPGYTEELVGFFLAEQDVERAFDAVELSFRLIDNSTRDYNYLFRSDFSERADSAIEELNSRFREHGVGFEFSDGRILRVDSEYAHAEIIKPALQLMSKKQFAGAQQEFLKAHEHYRAANAKEALNECLKAFESAMKGICDKRGWVYSKNATAKDMIQVCLDHELIPTFWQQHYSSLRSLLESSVPTGRNKLSGHGQGSRPVQVPDYVVAYMLHMTASALVFLAEADANLP